jgi:dTDP-4-amino-4,6-dideoxygalactose transaminase
VPLVDLAAANAEVADQIAAGIADVVRRGAFILGGEVAAFEADFARFTGTRHCIGLSNGTDALELAMRGVGIGAGDEVLVPANTFLATAAAVSRTGAVPVFVDCDPKHLLLDPAQLERHCTARTRAVVPVHLYGQMAPMAEISAFAQSRGLFVFEDVAQAQGARQNGRAAGTCSTAGATSFYPSKNLGAFGDAGAVVTDDDELAAAIRALRNYGSTRKYEHPVVGFNCRLDTLQAVVLRSKLARLAAWNEQRRAAAARYDAMLRDVAEVRPVAVRPGNEHVFHLYVVELLAGDRETVMQYMQAAGIGAGVHYPVPLPLTGAYAGSPAGSGQAHDCPVALAASRRILSLPLYPQLTADQQERVVTALRSALRGAPAS